MVAQIDSVYIKMRPSKFIQRLMSYSLFEGRPLTTSGRWINPLIFAHFASEKRLPLMKRVKKPVFIIGTGRSGTTLLGILLSMHKDVGYLNEPKALWHAVHPGEDIIGSYSDGEANYRLGTLDADPQRNEAAHKLFGAYLRIIGARRVVDKYPELVFRVPFVHAIFPDAKFILLTRNGHDTAASIMKWSKRKGEYRSSVSYDWWGKGRRKWKLLVEQVAIGDPDLGPIAESLRSMTDHLAMAMVEWIVSMREGLAMIKRFPKDILLLRYEDLTANPGGKLKELLQFCELPGDNIFMQYAFYKIRSSGGHSRADVPDYLRPAFDQVMVDLGYTESITRD